MIRRRTAESVPMMPLPHPARYGTPAGIPDARLAHAQASMFHVEQFASGIDAWFELLGDVPRGTVSRATQFGTRIKMDSPFQKQKKCLQKTRVFHRDGNFMTLTVSSRLPVRSSFCTSACSPFTSLRSERFPQTCPVLHSASAYPQNALPFYS